MSKWIDADALIAKMPTVMDMQDTYLPIHFKEWLIDEAPTIYIVRCKECKWQSVITDEEEGTSYYMCGIWTMPTDEDVFCSYGERKESE